MEYDFSKLNDKEFESLSIDLLSAVEGIRIERFKPGKDQGVDGRFFNDKSHEVIIQCKQYSKSGVTHLLSDLRKKEKEKVDKLSPARYILITSLELSRANKQKILEIFAPYIKTESDIYGAEDLNDILSKNPKIVEKHYKLWITSTEVLKNIFFNAIKGRSQFQIELLELQSEKYVTTQNHFRAIEHLKESNVIIITGEPGIGKTTLAGNLCLYFSAKGYEFISVEESIREAEDLYEKSKKQFFFFDDFLGSNYLEAIEYKKDSYIMNFIKRIIHDKSKYFILTSRTNIINTGVFLSPTFSNGKLLKNEFLLKMEDLEPIDKARILYNHIWFSKLEDDFIDIFFENKNYRKIINHKNFNPRLIDFITDNDRFQLTSSEYWDYILNKLSNPSDVWENCFKVQNNPFARGLVNLVVYNGGSINEIDLQKSYINYCRIRKIVNSSTTEYDFLSITKIATKSLLNRNIIKDEITYTIINPSLADYVLKVHKHNDIELESVIISLSTMKSLDHFISLSATGYFLEKTQLEITKKIIEKNIHNLDNISYSIKICRFYYDLTSDFQFIEGLFNSILSKLEKTHEIESLLYLLNVYLDTNQIDSLEAIYESLFFRSLKDKEILILNDIFKKMNNLSDEDYDKRHDLIRGFLNDKAEDIINNMDFSDYFLSYEANEVGYDYSRIEESIIESLDDELVYVSELEFDDDKLDVYDIAVQGINIDEYISDFETAMAEGQENFEHVSQAVSFDSVDDLFER